MSRSMIEVLTNATTWLSAQEAFQLCGISDNAEVDAIEALYAELRTLDEAGILEIKPVRDEKGWKLYDQLKLRTI